MDTKKILIGIPVKNTGIYLENLFGQLLRLDYDKSLITIVMVEGDSKDDSYSVCQSLAKTITEFRKIVIEKLDFGFDLNHNQDRYIYSNFVPRIQNLVITRNYIVDNYLTDNDYVWWVDSDFEQIPPDAIGKFISCNKDIVIPMLTHDRWGYHDCGSVIFDGERQLRFQYQTSVTGLVKLDRTDTHCFIKASVFEKLRYVFVMKPYFDGCGNHQNCWSDGTWFSLEANKLGFEVYGALHIIIKHHDV